MPDAFRHGLGYAVQWYNMLQRALEAQIDEALLSADTQIQSFLHSGLAQPDTSTCQLDIFSPTPSVDLSTLVKTALPSMLAFISQDLHPPYHRLYPHLHPSQTSQTYKIPCQIHIHCLHRGNASKSYTKDAQHALVAYGMGGL